MTLSEQRAVVTVLNKWHFSTTRLFRAGTTRISLPPSPNQWWQAWTTFSQPAGGDLAIVDPSEEVVKAGGSFISYMLFLTKT
jgi:hypothetical protein